MTVRFYFLNRAIESISGGDEGQRGGEDDEEGGMWAHGEPRTRNRRPGYGANALDTWDFIFLTVKGDEKVYFATFR
jgi:hypothetical protein